MEAELMLGIPGVLVLIAVFMCCYIYLYKEVGLPPGPMKLPIVGNIFFFKRLHNDKRPLHVVLHEEAKTYGDILYLKHGNQRLMYVNGYDTIHEVFVKNSELSSDRPTWLHVAQEHIKEGRGLVWQDHGPERKTIRKFVTQALRDFGDKASFEERIVIETDAVIALLNKSDGKPIELKPLLEHMVVNIIHGMVFGKRLEFAGETMDSIVKVMNVWFRRVSSVLGENVPEWLFKLLSPDMYMRTQKRDKGIQWFKDYVHNEIEHHQQTYDGNNIRDFVDLYIQARSEEADGDKTTHSSGNLFRVINDLFAGGTETTYGTLNWCILFMQEYPHIQQKCKDEIRQVCGTRRVNWSDRSALIYVEAVLLEIQRLRSIVKFPLYHSSKEEFTVQGYRIPRHTILLANIYSSLMDPKYWNDPHVFNPDRFIVDGKLTKNPAFILFFLGPRACPGDNLAKMELFLIFSNLLQKFTFKREDPNIEHSLEAERDMITASPLKYYTRAVPC